MLMLVLVISGSARATTDVMPFKDEAQEQQFRQLTEQLRCPKCQNNSIADSNAMIATDMRRRVYDLMQEGKSRQEIIDYMVARYGNFVTYDPPLTPLTVLLWVLPLAAIVAGGWIIVARTRRRVRLRREPLPADTPGLRRARRVGRLRAGGRHCAGGRRRQLRPDRQLSAGQGLAAGNGADARAAGAGAGPGGAAAE
ncbi:cytochrome c-type biogenesis protein H1 [Salmonella enterica subsp. enterica]|nr:cytochrome c-type biogenesis protein H1 [Salmonella enterica subsp. enterica]